MISSISPTAAPVLGGPVTVQITGSGFNAASVVQWNGTDIPTIYNNASYVEATIPASDLQNLGNNAITVYNAPPGGGTSAPQALAVYLPVQTNDLVYNSTTQLLYASIPSSAGPTLGNSIVSIDPVTGALGTPVWVGSEPTKLALSSDGTILWVGLNGAAAVREVNLTTNIPGTQFSLGGGGGVYNAPNVAAAIAVMPGNPNTVAVAYSNLGAWWEGGVAVFDSGVKRPQTSSTLLTGLAFSPSGNEIYGVVIGSGYYVLSVDNTGITASTQKNADVNASDLRVVSGSAYLTSGNVLDAEQGTLTGNFYQNQSQAAVGPVAVDTTIGSAWIIETNNYLSSPVIGAFKTSTYVLYGSIYYGAVSDNSSPGSLVRWGQNGLAFRQQTAVYSITSPLVRDLSHTLADLSLAASGPANGTTGTNLSYTLTVTNNGPNTANQVSLTDNVPQGTSFSSVSNSQGSCTGTYVVQCDLGTLANLGTATVTINVTALSAGAVQNTAQVSAAQSDPNLANNTAITNTIISGQTYNPVPSLTNISPQNAQAASGPFMLTVNGANFVSNSVVLWNGAGLPTTYVSSTQLTVQVAGSLVASPGWVWVSIFNPAPGGGTASAQPFSIFQVISLDTNFILLDPFTRKLYASVPGTAPQLQGNSIVAVDPVTGALGSAINVGSQPTRMAESDDGQWLYVILSGSNQLARYNLETGQVDPTRYSLTPPGGDSPTRETWQSCRAATARWRSISVPLSVTVSTTLPTGAAASVASSPAGTLAQACNFLVPVNCTPTTSTPAVRNSFATTSQPMDWHISMPARLSTSAVRWPSNWTRALFTDREAAWLIRYQRPPNKSALTIS